MPGAALHDEAVAERLCKQLVDGHTIESDLERALRQARLPPTMGGLGLTSAADASLPSYAASHARSSAIARRLSPTFAAIIAAAVSTGTTIPSIQAAVSAVESIACERRGTQATWDTWDSTPLYYEPCMGARGTVPVPPLQAAPGPPLSLPARWPDCRHARRHASRPAACLHARPTPSQLAMPHEATMPSTLALLTHTTPPSSLMHLSLGQATI